MTEFWIFVNFQIWQNSEYASGCNYGRVLNIPGFRVYQVSAYARVAQGSECAWSTFHRVLNKLSGKASGSKCQGSEYDSLSICEGYTGCWICLNKP